MDTIQFIEEVLDIKLLDYQKRLIKEMEEHPDYKFRIPRSRTTPSWYYAYLINEVYKKDLIGGMYEKMD